MNTSEENDDSIKLPLVPAQRSGKAIDAEASALFGSEQSATVFFELVKNRLQHVNSWSIIGGKLSAEFQLVNKEGLEVFRKAQQGDFLRIDIPGPGGKAGHGFDWVKIEQVDNDVEGSRFGFRVRPSHQPAVHTGMSNQIAPDHFYDQESTSTFMVLRDGPRVTVKISDRNTKPNTQTKHIVDSIRNTVVGWAARARFSEIQWQSLAEGLMSRV